MIKKYCPEWFNIEYYNLCQQFSRFSWRKAISDRQLISKNNSCKIEDFYRISSKEYFQSVIDIKYETFFDEPIVKQFNFDEYYQIVEDAINDAETPCSTIEPLVSDYGGVSFKRNDPSGFRSMQFEYIKNSFDYPFIAYKKEVISVDFNASDSDILEYFKVWLSSKRKEYNFMDAPMRRLSDNEVQKLVDFNVLAYIDLNIWNKQHFNKALGRKLTQAQISNLLYAGEYDIDITSRVRLVTKPKAEEIMKSDILIF